MEPVNEGASLAMHGVTSKDSPATIHASSIALRCIDVLFVLPITVLLHRRYGVRPAARFLVGSIVALVTQHLFLRAVTRRTGSACLSAADTLTLARANCGALLAGIVASTVRDRSGTAGYLAWCCTLWGATVGDWLDGPLARHVGTSAIGAALDIEADSWLTLWSAVTAIAWGELPPWCAVPPTLRYALPLLAMRRGGLPSGGDPWWGRATGVAQMALIVVALAPTRPDQPALRVLARIVSGSQGVSVLLLILRQARSHRSTA